MSLSQMVKEVQEYNRKRTRDGMCLTSWVQPLCGGIVLNGIPHSGVVSHICNRRQHPGGEPCECACGKRELLKK